MSFSFIIFNLNFMDITKPNILETTRTKGQKFSWTTWVPSPSCWLKSLVLVIFLRVIILVADIYIFANKCYNHPLNIIMQFLNPF
jgi:hypothetical protein